MTTNEVARPPRTYDRTARTQPPRRWLWALLALALGPLTASSSSAQDWTNDPDRVPAGYDVDGKTLFPCAGSSSQSGLQVGKIRNGESICFVAYNGKELYTRRPVLGVYVKWASPSSTAPRVSGGTEPLGSGWRILHICRAEIDGRMTPGKELDGEAGCHISYGGQELVRTKYQVIVESDFTVTNAQGLRYDSIPGGRDANGQTLYPCLAVYNGGLHPGKTRAGWNSCAVPYGGEERWVADFWTLVPQFITPSPWNRPYYGPGMGQGVCRTPHGNSVQVGKYLVPEGRCNFSYAGGEVSVTSNFEIMTKP